MNPLSSVASLLLLAISGTAYASRADSEAGVLPTEEGATAATEARSPVRQKPRPQGGSSERGQQSRESRESRDRPAQSRPAQAPRSENAPRQETARHSESRSDRRPVAVRSNRPHPEAARHGHSSYRSRPVRGYSHRHYRYHHVRPYHGVFVYGPPPVHHHRYARSRNVVVEEAHLPSRTLDRSGSVAVGIQGGSIFSGYEDASGYADAGLGLGVRYRPAEAIGLEASVTHYNQTFNPQSERLQTVGQVSAELFAFPWTRVSPYAIGGLTFNARQFDDDRLNDFSGNVDNYRTADLQWGPHAGLGIEFALGHSVAIDLEARYTGFVTGRDDDPTLGGAFQTTAGLKAHF